MADQFAYIETRVRMLFALFNRKESEEMIQVFQTKLSHYPNATLRKVFDKCECELEKFPSLKQVLTFCAIETPGEGWKYNYKPGKDPDGVPCLIDPNPAPGQSKYLYRPQDCAEGRAFLECFAKLAEKKIPQLDEEASRANLQAQASAITHDPDYMREPGDDDL